METCLDGKGSENTNFNRNKNTFSVIVLEYFFLEKIIFFILRTYLQSPLLSC